MKGENMVESESKDIPRFESLDKLVEFFDDHDLGEYWDNMPESHFEVDIKRKVYLFALDSEVADRLKEIAISKQTSTEELINTWLREKIQEQM
jgi:CopG antitoxin of type II toxin-antitoxin system